MCIGACVHGHFIAWAIAWNADHRKTAEEAKDFTDEGLYWNPSAVGKNRLQMEVNERTLSEIAKRFDLYCCNFH